MELFPVLIRPALEKAFFLKTFLLKFCEGLIRMGDETFWMLFFLQKKQFFVFFQKFCKQNGKLVS